MALDIVGSDIPKGTEVKWYAGGVAKAESITVVAGDVTAGGVTLESLAEYGSVVGKINNMKVEGFTEHLVAKTTAATEKSGCDFIGYTGITAGDILEVYYITVPVGTPLKQVAACQDVKCSSKADEKKAAVSGQANKLSSIGCVENTADLNGLHYNSDFISLNLGDQMANSPAVGMKKWTSKFHGMKKIGCLIGKRYDELGNVVYKWFLVGAQANEVSSEFPTEDFYKENLKYAVDYRSECNTAVAA